MKFDLQIPQNKLKQTFRFLDFPSQNIKSFSQNNFKFKKSQTLPNFGFFGLQPTKLQYFPPKITTFVSFDTSTYKTSIKNSQNNFKITKLQL